MIAKTGANVALLVAVAVAQARASGQSLPTIRTSTRIVAVTIVAAHPDGSQVDDLRPSELRVFDNGKPQTILSFEPMRAGAVSESGTPGAPKSATPSGAENDPHSSIILLDALNTSWSDQAFARRAVQPLLDYLPTGERTALFALSDHLYLLHDFSSNPATLRAALRAVSTKQPRGGTVSSQDGPYSAAVSYSGLAAFSNLTHSREVAAGAEAQFYERIRILQTFEALAAIARLAKSIPGQKDLLWVSSAFPLLIHGRNDSLDNDSYYDQEKETARALSSAGLRVYPIDARGLSANPNAIINIATMQILADDTGGKAFFNNNDLSSLMRRALKDSRQGYLLTYTPAALRDDGSYHTIRLRVSRSGVKLRYRPGYYAEASPPKSDTKH